MRIAKVRKVRTPERGTDGSAGIDFFVPEDFSVEIPPHKDALIPSGVKAEIPHGYMLMAANKSGVATSANACRRIGLTPKSTAFKGSVVIGACVVDEDYQGEIFIHLINTSDKFLQINPKMKIAQFVLVPILYDKVEEVDETELFGQASERGAGCFGSTDKL